MTELTSDKLAILLRDAEKAHRKYQKDLGILDENWPDWYAKFIVSKLDHKKSK